jgi:hypothetical protein
MVFIPYIIVPKIANPMAEAANSMSHVLSLVTTRKE